MQGVVVFCGSALGAGPAYAEAARSLGVELARAGKRVVYGGASVGLMGIVADAALTAGGEVVGVIPAAMVAKELAHKNLTRLEVVRTMHERKARMAELGSGVIALPGGFGTLDETFEMLTWAQLGISRRPVVLLDVAGFYEHLVRHVEHAAAQGFVKEPHRALVLRATTVADAIALATAGPHDVASPKGS